MGNKTKAEQKMNSKALGGDELRTPRHRRRKMQRLLEKNPALLEQYAKQMLLNGWRPEGYDDPPKPSDEAPAS